MQNPETGIKLRSYFLELLLVNAKHWLLFICHLTRQAASSPFLLTSKRRGGAPQCEKLTPGHGAFAKPRNTTKLLIKLPGLAIMVSFLREGKQQSPAKVLPAAQHGTDSAKPCKLLIAKGICARKCLHSPERKHPPCICP